MIFAAASAGRSASAGVTHLAGRLASGASGVIGAVTRVRLKAATFGMGVARFAASGVSGVSTKAHTQGAASPRVGGLAALSHALRGQAAAGSTEVNLILLVLKMIGALFGQNGMKRVGAPLARIVLTETPIGRNQRRRYFKVGL
jgi:hypothetical protein